MDFLEPVRNGSKYLYIEVAIVTREIADSCKDKDFLLSTTDESNQPTKLQDWLSLTKTGPC